MSRRVFYFSCSFSDDPEDIRVEIIDDFVERVCADYVVTQKAHVISRFPGGFYASVDDAVAHKWSPGRNISVCDDAGTNVCRFRCLGFYYDSSDDREEIAGARDLAADVCTKEYRDMLERQQAVVDIMKVRVKDFIAKARAGEETQEESDE